MRVTTEQKAETRQRILDAAGRLFRQHGIDGVGVDAVMGSAGLTHGGFYGHFASKEALAAEVCANALSRSAAHWARLEAENGREDALRSIVDGYLGAGRVPFGGPGCIVPVLGADLARRPHSQPALTAALREMIDTLARCLPRRRRPARERALAGFASLVGAVVLARLSSDPALAEEILQAVRADLAGPG